MDSIIRIIHRLAFWFSFAGIFIFIADFGTKQSELWMTVFHTAYYLIIAFGLFSIILRYYHQPTKFRRKAFIFDAITVLFTLYIIIISLGTFYIHHKSTFQDNIWLKFAVLFTFIREFSELGLVFKRKILNPAQLFVASFICVIFGGALLLMLPNATTNGIRFVDALFTATSAVCVTGLAVLNTANDFTIFGQSIIIFLIQVGGLGILTFVSYFSYFFKGSTTFENEIAMSDMVYTNNIGRVFAVLKNIIITTFSIELFSAILIFVSMSGYDMGLMEKIYFSVFHAISAFCNAGFSTLSNSMYDESVRFNYSLQLIIVFTLVMGGLGFAIVENLKQWIQYRLRFLFNIKRKPLQHRPWVLNITSRISLITTIILIIVGWLFFFVAEYGNTLSEHSLFGKLVTALFGATTPRTAGFNSVDMGALSLPTIMITFLLMWIGAAPASTGGGIKTTSLAVAVLNIYSLVRGKSKIEVFRREISQSSVQRAFAAIALSLVTLGVSTMLVAIFDPKKELMSLAFECFSAFSTSGLSLGITGSLSDPSKYVVISTMFIGRIGLFTFLMAIIRKKRLFLYRYPVEEITIN